MRILGLLSVYIVVALLVTALWTDQACTEKYRSRSGYNSIVALSDGTAPIPFVRRRLVFDVARVVASVVPPGAWHALEENPRIWQIVRARGFGWQPRDSRVLFSTTALIGFSVFGFMVVSRAVVARLYRSPPWLPGLVGLALGFMLMGGGGHGHYFWYPYDFPNAFVFALTLFGFLTERPWAYLSFAASCYSKETAFTLILGRWLLLEDRRRWRPYLTLAVMLTFFVIVQHGLRTAYSSPKGEGFWMLERNLTMLVKFTLFDSWLLLLIVLGAIRVTRVWGDFPCQLRRLTAIPLLLMAAAILKGWLEERRQYAEALVIFGPMLIQWILLELGIGDLMVPRETTSPAANEAPLTLAQPA